MKALAHLSDIIVPMLIFFIVGYGYVSKVKVYESFLTGARDGLKILTQTMRFIALWRALYSAPIPPSAVLLKISQPEISLPMRETVSVIIVL